MRPATSDEVSELSICPIPGADMWVVVSEGEGVTGQCALSFVLGGCYLHDVMYWGDDKTAVARMYLRARSEARRRGLTTWLVSSSNPDVQRFCEGAGYQELYRLYEGRIA